MTQPVLLGENGEQQSQFTNSSSSGLNPAYVHVGKIEDNSSVNDDEPQMGMKSMMYRVSLLNQELLSTTPSLNDFELSQTDLPVNTKLNLTFTYEMGPPRYLIVSGAKVTAFKHRMPDWENPGSFYHFRRNGCPSCIGFKFRWFDCIYFRNYHRNGRRKIL